MRRTRLLLLLVLLATHGLHPSRATAAPQPFGLGDFFRVRSAADPQIAPDGSRVAYVEVQSDVATDSYRTRVRLVTVRERRTLDIVPADTSTSLPRWSPDGKRFALVRATAQGAELLVADASRLGGAVPVPYDVVPLPVGARDIEWSPDGRRLAFLGAVSTPRRAALGSTPPAGASWAPAPWVLDSGGFQSPAEALPRDAKSIALFVVDLANGETRRVTNESLGEFFPYTGSGLTWSSDGRRVIAGLQLGRDAWRNLLQSALYAIDVDSGAVRKLHGGPLGAAFLPTVAPNGALAFACRPPTRENLIRFEICVGEQEAGPYRSIAPDIDSMILPLRIAADGRGAYGVYGRRGVSHLAWFGFNGEREELATTGGGTVDAYMSGGAFSVARDGTVAFLYSDSRTPSELAVVRRGKPMRILTRLNEELLATRELNPVDEVTFTPTDGAADVHAFVVKPARIDATKKPPAIVMLHGGQSSDYGPAFDPVTQVFAAHGYLVILPNYRGSGSYGRAFSNVPGSPVGREHDVLGAAETLVRQYGADPERLYVMGGSGGALISAWTIGQSSRFRAAVLWYAPLEWWVYAMDSATGPTSLYAGFDHPPWEQPAAYVARSPYAYLGNVRTPTMLIVGDQDRITPLSGSIAYFRGLQTRGVPSELIVYPGASHGLADRPSQAMGHIAETLGWLARNGGTPVVAPKLPTSTDAKAAP